MKASGRFVAVIAGPLALTAGAASPKTISFVSVVAKEKQMSSNTFVQYGNDLSGKKKIGTDVFKCTVTKGGTLYVCTDVVTLTGGSIKMAAQIGSKETSGSLKVTGGTGMYAKATGSASFKQLGKDTKTDITIKLA